MLYKHQDSFDDKFVEKWRKGAYTDFGPRGPNTYVHNTYHISANGGPFQVHHTTVDSTLHESKSTTRGQLPQPARLFFWHQHCCLGVSWTVSSKSSG